MNKKRTHKIRTVAVNDRGQIVIPDDIRRDLEISGNSTLVLIEREGEILLKKESEVLSAMGEDSFWKSVSRETMKRAWGKDDDVWDEIARNDMHE